MATATATATVQEELAAKGEIRGTIDEVRSLIKVLIYEDGRFRTVEAGYSNPAKGEYSVTVARHPDESVKGSRSPEEQRRREQEHGLVSVFCVDTGRQGQWRTPKVALIRAIQVFIRDRNGGTRTVRLPVVVVDGPKGVRA